jgi:hypothetical protein
MVVGDSLAGNLAFGLAHVAGKYNFDLLNYTAEGCSIAVGGRMRWPNGQVHDFAGGCYSRRSGLAAEVKRFDPDVVLVHSSIFDILDRHVDGWGDFSAIGTQPMDGWLVDQNRQVTNILGSQGARVIWSTIPCASFNPVIHGNHHTDAEGNRRIDLANQRIRQLGTTLADLDARVCPGGGYSSSVEGDPVGRTDGVHFSPDAARRLADRWLAPLLLTNRP